MMGISGRPVAFNQMILPLESHGVKIISMGFFVDEETPVIWRGPMLHKAVQQFLGDVYWGDLDYLLADLPPGTGDVSISMASFLPGANMLVVTTPQEAARKVAERAGKMAGQARLKVLGVVENMSYFVCPSCNERHHIFGEGGGQEAADTLDVPLLGQVPLMASLREGGDSGTPIMVSDPDSPAASSSPGRGRDRPPLEEQGRQAAGAHRGRRRRTCGDRWPRRPRPRRPLALGPRPTGPSTSPFGGAGSPAPRATRSNRRSSPR